MQHVRELLNREIETLATRTNTVISANTAAASEWDFQFHTFGEAKLSEMLGAAKDFIRDMAIGTARRWLSFLGRSGTGKTHLARSIARFFVYYTLDWSLGNEMTEYTEVRRLPLGAAAMGGHGQTFVDRREFRAWYPLKFAVLIQSLVGQVVKEIAEPLRRRTRARWQDGPEPRGFVVGGCDDAVPIGAELRAVNGAFMALKCSQQLAAVRVPEPRGFVGGGCDDALPIGAELRAVNGAFMALECGQ
jgi:hypothetical protein